MYRITNNSKGRRGIWARGRLVWLGPGETKSLSPDRIASARLVPDLDIEALDELPEVPDELKAAVVKSAKPRPPAKAKAAARRRRRKVA